MALTKGHITSDRRVPSASTYSFTHTQNGGTGDYLFVVIACPATTVSSVTYNTGSTATNIIMVTEIKEVVTIVTSTQGMMMMMF